MSDHGKGEAYILSHHIILKVQGEGLPRGAEKRLFSLADFSKLIDWLVAPNDSKYNELLRQEAAIQDLDYYNKKHINMRVGKKLFLDALIGYHGTVTMEDLYIRRNNGLEFFWKHKNDGVLFTPERLEYLRSVTGTKKLDVWTEEKLQYARYTYRILEKYHQRNHEYEERKTAALKSLLGENKCSRGGVFWLSILAEWRHIGSCCGWG
jgi:hypothetical protein